MIQLAALLVALAIGGGSSAGSAGPLALALCLVGLRVPGARQTSSWRPPDMKLDHHTGHGHRHEVV